MKIRNKMKKEVPDASNLQIIVKTTAHNENSIKYIVTHHDIYLYYKYYN